MSNITIQGKEIKSGRNPYIIAEMACAHDGQFEKAKKLIDSSVEAKADAVQLQFFASDYVVTPHHQVFGILKKIEFSERQWEDLFKYGKDRGIAVWACTYDEPSAALAIRLGVDGIKLNSADLSNPDLVSTVAKSGIPFTLGTGASTMEEIASAVRIIAEAGNLDKVILMHGVQNFPTAIENLQISRIKLLKHAFGLPVGYADHTDASNPFAQCVDLLAMGMGIVLLEKHITWDRAEKGIDYQAALEPTELADYVLRVRTAALALGISHAQPLGESDLRYRQFQKKSIVAAHDLQKGKILERADVLYIRNAENGLSPSDFAKMQGKKLVSSIAKHDNILLKDIE